MAWGGKARDVADRPQQRDRGDRADPGQRHQPQRVVAAERVGGDELVHARDLVRDEVELTQAGLHGQALVEGQAVDALGEPAASLDPEEVAHRRPRRQVALQHRVHLVLRARALAHERAPSRREAPPRSGRLVGGPDPVEESDREQLRQRPRVDLVGLRAPRRVPDRLGVGEHDPAHVRLEDARDRQGVRRRLERDLVRRGQALGEELERFGTRRHPPRRAHAASLGDRDLAEVAMHVHPDAAHPTPPHARTTRRRGGGRSDSYGYVLAAHPDTRGGGQLQTAGSQPIQATACPTSALQSPRPGPPATLRLGPDGNSAAHLHPPTTARACTRRSATSPRRSTRNGARSRRSSPGENWTTCAG